MNLDKAFQTVDSGRLSKRQKKDEEKRFDNDDEPAPRKPPKPERPASKKTLDGERKVPLCF